MKLIPKIDLSRFETQLQVVDAHTCGEFCRVVIGGFAEPQGETMLERKTWMEQNCDHLRTSLMLEPRGHRDMFGAFICEPIREEADFGVIFMDTGGYLNMCGHCTIGAVTVILEAGLMPMHEGENRVVLDVPSGLIVTTALVKNGQVESVSLTNVPSFVYEENCTVNIDGKDIHFLISFGGSFFALVDSEQLDLGPISSKTVRKYTKLGMKMLKAINEQIPVQHPTLDIHTVDLVEFYGPTPNPDKASMRNVVVFGEGSADRSPCGTGTSAKLAALYHLGKLKVGESFRYESFIGSVFHGTIQETVDLDDYKAVVPVITGSAYLTGFGSYLIDPQDPLKYGFHC